MPGDAMTDLFDSMQEHHAERLAIMQESSVPDPVGAAEDDRHRCEVATVMRQCWPDNIAVSKYLLAVEKNRGAAAAQKLRADVLAAWRQRQRDEIAGQA